MRCGEPTPEHPHRRGCGLEVPAVNQWGICEDCALDNGVGMQAVADRIYEKERAWFENDTAWDWQHEAYEGADQ